MTKLILSLCDYSGEWSRPYLRRGYEVVMVDLNHPTGERKHADGSWRIGADVTRYEFDWQPHGPQPAPGATGSP